MEEGSYLLLAPGMIVRGTDGDLGTIAEVVADENADIFRGVTLARGLFAHHVFLPGERITAVRDNVAFTNLSRAEGENLASVDADTRG